MKKLVLSLLLVAAVHTSLVSKEIKTQKPYCGLAVVQELLTSVVDKFFKKVTTVTLLERQFPVFNCAPPTSVDS